MPYMEPTSHRRTRSQVPQVITPQLRAFRDSPWSLYLSRWEDAIRGNSMVSSLFVQIGVLNFQSLTTANVIGERIRNVWLTLAMPRGNWLLISRYRRASSKSRLRSPEVQERYNQFHHKTQEMKNSKRCWSCRIRGL